MPEPPTSSVDEFFPFSRCHLVDLHSDSHISGVVRPSHVTLESALWCTYPLLKYTVEETTEVVGFTHFFPSLLNHPAMIPVLLLFQGVATIHSLMQQ